MTNTRKLKGRMAEKEYSLTLLAERMHISRPALRAKINGLSEFKVSEIENVCYLLEIKPSDMQQYFFAANVPTLET